MGEPALGSRDHSRRATLTVLCTVLFVTFLDNTIVSVTLADIQSKLHAGVQTLQWVVNGYALAFASLMLVGGMLGDLFGRRRIMVGGLVVFSAGSVVAAIAPSAGWLLVGRVVMGVGAAGSEPATLSILRHVYVERRSRARAMGVWAAVSGTALAMGPVVAGVLVGISDWRAVFWFNLALGAVAIIATFAFVPESSDPEGTSVDVTGAALGAAALAATIYAVIEGERAGYGTWWIITLFIFSALCAIGFVLVELRRDRPMLDLRLLRREPFTVSNVVAFTTYFGIFSIFFFVALFLQLLADRSPFATAADFVPMTVIMIAASALTGRWVAKVGPKIPMTVGCVLAAAGILLVDTFLGPDVGFVELSWTLGIAGAGFGIALVPVVSAAMSSVEPEHSGMAAAATNTSRELGAVFGVAILGAIVNGQLTSNLIARLQQLGIPANFQSVVIEGVTHGGVPQNAQQATQQNPAAAAAPELVDKVIDAAEHAFQSGLHTALLISSCLLFGSAVVVWFTFSHAESAVSARERSAEPVDESTPWADIPPRSLGSYARMVAVMFVVVGAAFGIGKLIEPEVPPPTAGGSDSQSTQTTTPASSTDNGSNSANGSTGASDGKGSTTSAPAGPTITVEPAKGLHDGQKVKITGSGFSPGTSLVAIECAGEGDSTSPDDCDIPNVSPVTADGSGKVSVTFEVNAGPFGSAGRSCDGDKCLIAVSQPSAKGSAERATADLSFSTK